MIFPDKSILLKYAAKIDLIEGFNAGRPKQKDDDIDTGMFNMGMDNAEDGGEVNPNGLTPIKVETKPVDLPKAKPLGTDAYYQMWKKQPGPHSITPVVTSLRPSIDAALRTYGGVGNPLMESRARKLAIDAINSYNPNNKTKASLASWVTLNLQGLQRYRNDLAPIPVPERVRLDNVRIQTAKDEFVNENGRNPTIEELADHTGISPKRINYVRKLSKPVLNEGQFSESDDADSGKYAPGIDTNEWQNIWLEYVYNDLSPIDKQIYDMRMGRGEYAGKNISVNEVAAKLGITPSAVSQRSNKISNKLAEMYTYENKL